MWCDRCRADAPAKVSAETGRAACQTCGQDLGKVGVPSTDQARELLKRWSSTPSVEAPLDTSPETDFRVPPQEAASARPRVPRPQPEPAPARATAQPISPSRLRKDKPPKLAAAPVENNEPAFSVKKQPTQEATDRRPASKVKMSAEPSPRQQKRPAKRSSGLFGRFLGQFMAYLGILAITGGTALVIWGYFGGPAEYAPTGWLVATGGQMMLMLGVATLVSEGLDQSSRELRCQIELIDHRLERIEQNAVRSSHQNGMGNPVPISSSSIRQTAAI